MKSTASIARDAAVAEVRSHVDAPYFIGAEGPAEFDCNGLIFRGWTVAGVYPWKSRHAAADFPSLPRVAWEDRLPGDVVCFGNAAGCHHVAMVADLGSLVGANHGGNKLALESDEDYRRRMAAQDGGRGARVCVVPSSYWESARLCVVRAPSLVDAEGVIA